MVQIDQFTFGPFQENTYLLVVENGDCVIVDPGVSNREENQRLASYITEKGLNPVGVWLTHTHIDHVLGCAFVCETYDLTPIAHPLEMPVMEMAKRSSELYGIPYTPGPTPEYSLEEGQKLTLGDHSFEVRFAPGHCPGHVVFVHDYQRFVIGGDVLFHGSVGRVDLPGGDGPTLEKSIREKLYTLPDEFLVYPGHGPKTSIGFEKENNGFVSNTRSGLL